MPVSLMIRSGIMIAILMIHDGYTFKHDIQLAIRKQPLMVRWVGYLAFLWMFITFMPIGAEQEFIYFQF